MPIGVGVAPCFCSLFFAFALAFLSFLKYNIVVAGVLLFPFSVVAAVLPSLSVVSRVACCWAASGFGVRPSGRGLGGFVAVVGFRRSSLASGFAALWGARLPFVCRGCVVRFGGGLFWVSVPVLPASVPALVRSSRAPLVVVGSPPALRSAFLAGGVWSVWAPPFPSPAGRGPSFSRPAPGARRRAFAAFWALGWPLPPRPVLAPPAVRSAVSAAPAVAFCGSRRAAPPAAVLGSVASLVPSSAPVLVGCVGGLCAAVRGRFARASVFRASSFGAGRGAFVARSVALVRACASAGGVWLSFPLAPCPPGLVPSARSSACFCGSGSGSWASLCLAVGLGVSAFVWLPPGVVPPAWLSSLGGGWFRAASPARLF